MSRLATRARALACTGAVAFAASPAFAHPGHGAPHVLHEGDGALVIWGLVVVAATAVAVRWLGKTRS